MPPFLFCCSVFILTVLTPTRRPSTSLRLLQTLWWGSCPTCLSCNSVLSTSYAVIGQISMEKGPQHGLHHPETGLLNKILFQSEIIHEKCIMAHLKGFSWWPVCNPVEFSKSVLTSKDLQGWEAPSLMFLLCYLDPMGFPSWGQGLLSSGTHSGVISFRFILTVSCTKKTFPIMKSRS